jgi:hypothetical protein
MKYLPRAESEDSRSSSVNPRWLPFLSVSIVVHALLIVVIAGSETRPALAGMRSQGMSVRLEGASVSSSIQRSEDTLRQAPEMGTMPTRKPKYPALLTLAAADIRSPGPDPSTYLPSSQVTQRATPLQEVEIPYPDTFHAPGRLTAKLMLFIDENGVVAKVGAAEPRLPRPFEEAAARAFEKARFNPAMLNGRPVKSRMLVQVVFDDAKSIGPDRSSAADAGKQ